MDEEEDCLNALIKQKCQRPLSSYTGNFPLDVCPPKTSRTKQRWKTKIGQMTPYNKSEHQIREFEYEHSNIIGSDISQSDSNIIGSDISQSDNSSDTDCSFYSAEEDFIESTDLPTEEQEKDFDYISSFDTSLLNTIYSYEHDLIKEDTVQVARKAPSKKQKRKRRMQMKLDHADNFNPLLIDSLCSLELSDFVHVLDDKVIHVHKTIPSLAELCVRCCKGVISGNYLICKKLRRKYVDIFTDMSLQKRQRSWLYYVLSSSEPTKGQLNHLRPAIYPTTYQVDHANEKAVFFHTCRNVWNPVLFTKKYENVHTDVTSKYKHPSSACLRNNIITQYISTFTPNVHLYIPTDSYRTIWKALISLSVYATTVDLMLAGTKQNNGKTARIRLKLDLQKRYPVGTRECFDLAIPYVHWARGEIKTATYDFCNLIENEKRGRMKALHMNELARMYSHIGHSDIAAKFYRIAEDTTLGKPKNTFSVNFVSGQTQMLLANLNDQGLLTDEKARNSKAHWNSIIMSEEITKENSAKSAIEALLCYHGYWWTDDKLTWLQVAADWLTGLTNIDTSLLYHLGCVNAFMGNYQDAERILKMTLIDFPRQTSTIAKNITVTQHWKQWACLTSCGSVRHLYVVWRTQLCPPLYSKLASKWRHEAEFCNEELNFRLNSDGNLTGDMQMVLPPIRSVCLNPYTGYLAFSSAIGRTESWKYHEKLSFRNRRESTVYNDELFYIPTPYELYRDDDGNNIYLLQPKSDHIYFPCYGRRSRATHSMFLIWRDRNGHTERLNLFLKIQEYLYKKTKTEIERENPPTKETLLKFLQLFYNRGWRISKTECLAKMKKFKDVKNVTSDPSQVTKKMCDLIPMITVEVPIQYGKALMLTVNYCEQFVLRVVVNCKGKETFHSPVIEEWYSGIHFLYNLKQFKHERTKGAEITWCMQWKMAIKRIFIYDQNGELIDEFLASAIEHRSDLSNIHVMGDNLVCIGEDGKMYLRKAQKTITFGGTGTYIEHLIVINAVLCIVKETDRMYVFNINTMKCMKFQIQVKEGIERDSLISNLHENSKSLQLTPDIKILKRKCVTIDSRIVNKLLLAADTLLLILQVPDQLTKEDVVTIETAIHLPGYPTDFCFITKDVGFLVTWTHFTSKEDEDYREHLFHFSTDGILLGILPFLGHSTFSFFPVYLNDDMEIQQKYPGYGTKGWYVYMRDGHGGILCLKLLDT